MESSTMTGKKWTQEEDDQLLRLYNEEKLDIIEIAKQHSRTPRVIIMRLIKNKVFKYDFEANGFIDYKNNYCYKENNITKIKKVIDSIKIINEDENKNDYLQIKEDITKIKEDIITLNSNITELITMIKQIVNT